MNRVLPYEIDEVTALPSGWVRRVAEPPRLEPPGDIFRYDNGAAHLLAAALTGALGEGVDHVAERELFRPLGIAGADWMRDPEGIAVGAAFLRLGLDHLATPGRLWLDGGRWEGRQLADAAFVVPATRAVIAVTGDPRFRLGPPPTDELPPDWRPALDLVRTYLLPVLRTG